MERIVIVANLLLVFMVMTACGNPVNQTDCQTKYVECLTKTYAKRSVCGSDGQTYKKCAMSKMQCEGSNISIQYKGSCWDSQPCLEGLRYMRKIEVSSDSFIPKCRPDGSYAPVQCRRDTGCWCVTAEGKPVPNTSVRNGRPKCRREKSNTRRRSSIRGHRNREGCGRADKSQFNFNLVKVLSNEFDREHPVIPSISGKDRLVIEWKFSVLDTDHSNYLDKLEYRPIRRLIKKATFELSSNMKDHSTEHFTVIVQWYNVVKPKRCARTFMELCDVDQDEVITKQEWINCITEDTDTHNYDGGARAPGADRRHSAIDDVPVKNDDDDDDDDGNDQDSGSAGVLRGSKPKIASFAPGFNDDSLDRNKDEGDSSDCLSDRKSVLDEQAFAIQKNGSFNGLVPECTPDGRYRRIQCHPQTGYCWCVYEDTGTPISGSAKNNESPKCDAFSTPSRPMKGCPEQKKAVFLQDLMELLKNEMVMSTNRTGIMHTSQEEEIAIFNFVMLDMNKNKNLERKEWKSFRKLVSKNRHLRRCGKKFPRYCDVNNDDKISMTEWLICLNAQRKDAEVVTTSIKSTTFSKRKGPNPLEAYLKGD